MEMNTLTAFVYGVGMFTLLSAVTGERKSENAVVKELSRASFGIYIIHIVFLDLLTGIFLPYRAFGERNPALYLLVLYILTFGCSLGAVYLLTRIKGLRKLFYYSD